MMKQLFSGRSPVVAIILLLLPVLLSVSFENTAAWAKDGAHYLDQAALEFRHGNYDDAADNYRKALKENPAEPHAYLGLSMALKAEGDYKHAVEILNQLISKNPDFAPAYYNLGEVYEAQGNYAQAKEAYKQYIDLSNGQIPNSPELRLKFRKMGLM